MELRPPMENDANAATAEELEQQAADVYVERALHGPVFRMAYEHVHTYCELFYLRSGTCTYTVNKAQWHLEAGDIFIVAPGSPHSTRYEGKTSCERFSSFACRRSFCRCCPRLPMNCAACWSGAEKLF